MLLINQTKIYSQKFLSLLVLYFFLVFPLLYSRSLEDTFEFPKQYVLILLSCVGVFSLAVCKNRWRFSLSVPFLTLTVFVVYALFSPIWASSPVLASRAGIVLLFQFLLAFLFIQVQTPLLRAKCRLAVIISVTAMALLGMGQLYYSCLYDFDPVVLGIAPTLGDWRDYIQSSLGNTDFLAGILCLFFPFMVMRFLQVRRRRYLWGGVVAIWTLALVVSWSVSAIFSLFFFFMVLVIGHRSFFYKPREMSILVVIAVGAVSFWAFNHPLNPLSGGILKLAFASERWHLGGPTRAIIWENARQIFLINPLSGAGFNNFIYLFPRYISPYILRNPEFLGYAGQFTNAVHNDVYQLFTELGLVGGLIFLYLCFYRIRTGWQKRDWFIMGFFSLFLLNSQMSFPFQLIVPSTFFFLMSVWNIPSHTWKHLRISPLLRGLVIILSVVVMAFTGRELIARSLYKQVRALQDREERQFSGIPEKIRRLDSEYHLAKLEGEKEEAEHIQEQIETLIARLPTRPEQLELLGKVFNLSPHYYDASSRYADILNQHQKYEQSIEVYEYVLSSLNTNDVYWGYAMALLHKERYEEVEGILVVMSDRLFRQKDIVYFLQLQQYLHEDH